MKKQFAFFAILILDFCAVSFVMAQEAKLFRFRYKDGETSRIISTVEEDVFVNGKFDHHASILNRVSISTSNPNNGTTGKISANFMTSEKSSTSSGRAFGWEQNYVSEFERDETGKYSIADAFFMPVVRDVPIFPDYAVKPGDEWTQEGHEAHDLRQNFGIEKPFKIPFQAKYVYVGEQKDESGKIFDVIKVSYDIYFESPKPRSAKTLKDLAIPASTKGFSNQTLYWDNERGVLDHYNEEFEIIITTFLEDKFVFVGEAFAHADEFSRTNTEENLKAVQAAVEELGLENVSVAKGELGLTISIENIQFLAESSVLMESEKQKLDRMAKIFSAYTNDLLITGYTALSGTAEGRKQLSQERAQAVADYLISKNVRDGTAIFIEGKGAENPVASNNTTQGRAKNRRVEITFLDN